MSITDKTITNIPAEQVKDADSASMFAANGAFVPARLSDDQAQNNSIFFSDDQSALVYKDSTGVLYTIDITGV